jgi:hypothetical protein
MKPAPIGVPVRPGNALPKTFCRWRPAGAGDCGNGTNEAAASEGSIMKYQKPKVVAKSAPKQSFAAGCPVKTTQSSNCSSLNRKCECGPMK